MAIKTETQGKQTKEISFPCLMKDVFSDVVMLFTQSNRAVCVVGDSDYYVGKVYDDLIPCEDRTEWELSPPVTISNA